MMNTQIFSAGRQSVAVIATLLGMGFSALNTAHAVPVAAGAAAGISGTTSAARPELAGSVIADRTHNFSMMMPSGGVIKGTFQERVIKRTTTGTLDFYFRLKNDPGSSGSVALVSRTNYSAFPVVDMDYRTDGLGSVDALVASFPGGSGAAAGTTQFDFHNAPIKPGSETRFHFIGTRATDYAETGLATLRGDGGAATRFQVFSPVVKTTPPVRRLPNLTTKIFGPTSAKRGEDISNKIKVIANNIGAVAAPGTTGVLNPANGFMIDVMLSSDMNVPAGFSTYSPSYSEDVLLLGGRVSNTHDLAAGASNSYAAGATIPRDTRPGRYFLAVRIDPGNKVVESNEADNTFFLPIQIF